MLFRPPSFIPHLVGDRRGGAAIAYTSVVARVSVATAAMLTTFGRRVGSVLNTTSNAMS